MYQVRVACDPATNSSVLSRGHGSSGIQNETGRPVEVVEGLVLVPGRPDGRAGLLDEQVVVVQPAVGEPISPARLPPAGKRITSSYAAICVQLRKSSKKRPDAVAAALDRALARRAEVLLDALAQRAPSRRHRAARRARARPVTLEVRGDVSVCAVSVSGSMAHPPIRSVGEHKLGAIPLADRPQSPPPISSGRFPRARRGLGGAGPAHQARPRRRCGARRYPCRRSGCWPTVSTCRARACAPRLPRSSTRLVLLEPAAGRSGPRVRGQPVPPDLWPETSFPEHDDLFALLEARRAIDPCLARARSRPRQRRAGPRGDDRRAARARERPSARGAERGALSPHALAAGLQPTARAAMREVYLRLEPVLNMAIPHTPMTRLASLTVHERTLAALRAGDDARGRGRHGRAPGAARGDL